MKTEDIPMNKTSKNTTNNTRMEALNQITEQLEASVREFMSGNKYKDFLTKMSQFHNYSLNNQLLISLQRPDATLCASFTKWKDMERMVKKGEKGIKIICPTPYKKQKIEEVKDPKTGKTELLEDGSPKKQIVEHTYINYKIGYIFDISQTDGKPLPTLSTPLEGNLDNTQKELKNALMQISPVPVSFLPIKGDANGYYHLQDKEIVVDSNISERQSLKTLIHEISHALLHDKEIVPDAPTDSNTREVQAESIAYVVSQYFGMDTSEYSFGYISGWSSDKNVQELKSSLEIIRNTSNDIINQIEQILTPKKSIDQEVTEKTLHKRRYM